VVLFSHADKKGSDAGKVTTDYGGFKAEARLERRR
jgi:hypothetical protein